MQLKPYLQLVKSAAKDWSADGAPRLAASLSFYTMLALAPLLLVIVGVAGLLFGRDQVREELVAQFGGFIGEQGATLVQGVLDNAKTPQGGVISTTIGVVLLLVGASGVFNELKDSLNRIWEVEPKPGHSILRVIRTRLFSFAMVFTIAFLLMVSLVVSTALAGLSAWMESRFSLPPIALQAINIVISFAVISALFAMIFRFVPDARIRWKDAFVGGIATGVLFTLGKFAIGMYLGRATVGSSYGAAGSLAVVLVWLYYSAMIFLFGAELTQAYATMCGCGIQPKPYAQRSTEAEQSVEKQERKTGRAGQGQGGEGRDGASARPA